VLRISLVEKAWCNRLPLTSRHALKVPALPTPGREMLVGSSHQILRAASRQVATQRPLFCSITAMRHPPPAPPEVFTHRQFLSLVSARRIRLEGGRGRCFSFCVAVHLESRRNERIRFRGLGFGTRNKGMELIAVGGFNRGWLQHVFMYAAIVRAARDRWC
jgi:hypothetical protein